MKPNHSRSKSRKASKLLIINQPELSRPDFPSIVQKILEDGVDVQVSSKTHVISLWRAISRAGYWSWSFRVGESAWCVRLSKTPVTGKPNPLVEECDRTFKTQYRQWTKFIPDLIKGHAISLPTKDEANQFSRSARYHLKKEELPSFKIAITPKRGKFEVKVVLEETGEER